MTHLHITSWVLALVLLGVAVWLYRFGKAKPGKIVHMVLRLDILLILYSDGSLIGGYFSGSALLPEAIIKALAGIWTIAAIEMIANKAKNRKPAKTWWIQFFIAFIIAVVLGFGRLPMGISG